MKYIKSFEKSEPKIRDYVICKDRNIEKINNVIHDKIGQIIKIYKIKKANIVEYHIYYPDLNYYPSEHIPHAYLHTNKFSQNYLVMFKEEIIFHSPNKEDCELFLSTKKYNM